MKTQANKKRRACTFDTGDLVLLRLQPYRQSTIKHRSSQKLAKRYFGPFTIKRRIGSLAYELDLPSSSRIHPVIHISQLRAFHGDTTIPYSTTIPSELVREIFGENDPGLSSRDVELRQEPTREVEPVRDEPFPTPAHLPGPACENSAEEGVDTHEMDRNFQEVTQEEEGKDPGYFHSEGESGKFPTSAKTNDFISTRVSLTKTAITPLDPRSDFSISKDHSNPLDALSSPHATLSLSDDPATLKD